MKDAPYYPSSTKKGPIVVLNKLWQQTVGPCVTKVPSLYGDQRVGGEDRDWIYCITYFCSFGVKFTLLDWDNALWGENYKSE